MLRETRPAGTGSDYVAAAARVALIGALWWALGWARGARKVKCLRKNNLSSQRLAPIEFNFGAQLCD